MEQFLFGEPIIPEVRKWAKGYGQGRIINGPHGPRGPGPPGVPHQPKLPHFVKKFPLNYTKVEKIFRCRRKTIQKLFASVGPVGGPH